MCRAVDLWAGSVSVHTSRAAVRPWGVVNRWCIVHTSTASGHPRARIFRDPAAFPCLTTFQSGRNASQCRRPATISLSCSPSYGLGGERRSWGTLASRFQTSWGTSPRIKTLPRSNSSFSCLAALRRTWPASIPTPLRSASFSALSSRCPRVSQRRFTA